MKFTAITFLLLFAAAADARSLLIVSKHVQYCDPHAHYDECGKHFFWHKYECVKLDHEEGCSYKEVCSSYKNGPCESYKYKDECKHVKGGCKVYKQEEKCDEKQECKFYEKKPACKPVEPSCEAYNDYGDCTKYGPSEACTYEQVCGEYYTKKENCRYEDTGDCKEYYYKEVCEKVKTDECKSYKQIPDCKKVKVDCKKGKCVKKVFGHFKKG